MAEVRPSSDIKLQVRFLNVNKHIEVIIDNLCEFRLPDSNQRRAQKGWV